MTDIAFWDRSVGNQERVFALVDALMRTYRVEVVFIDTEGADPPESLPNGCRITTLDVPLNDPPGQKIAALRASERARDMFIGFCQAKQPKVVIYEYLKLDFLLTEDLPAQINIVDTHDMFSARTQTFRRFNKKHFIEITEGEELARLNRFDGIMTIQHEDREFLSRSLGAHRIIYAPFSVSHIDRPHRHTASELIMVGGNSPMNTDGLRWFVREIWPLLSHSGATLNVFGDVCASIAPAPGIRLHGRAERAELEQGYHDADIAINPVYYGGGLKIKTVEYAAFGLPVVCSPEAVRGMVDLDRAPFAVSKTRADFFDNTFRMLHDPAWRMAFAARCAPYVTRHYGTSALNGLHSFIGACLEEGS